MTIGVFQSLLSHDLFIMPSSSSNIRQRWRTFRNSRSSASSSTSSPSTISRSQNGNSQSSGLTAHENSWAPIVLSLGEFKSCVHTLNPASNSQIDGGGIRGLSELFILRRIMERIQELIEEEGNNPVSYAFTEQNGNQSRFSEQPQLLPCYFFDYMVGTSTGGYGCSPYC